MKQAKPAGYENRLGAMVVAEPRNSYLPEQSKRLPEMVIQRIWESSLYDGRQLETTSGLSVKVLHPGRLNHGAGPDFLSARLIIGGITISGDVEIHIDSKSWYDHKHHTSPRYNRTRLHLFLHRSDGSPPAVTEAGEVLPELELCSHIRHPLESLQKELELEQMKHGSTPPCAAHFAGAESIAMFHSAMGCIGEGRMLIKADMLATEMADVSGQRLLQTMLCECLGYSCFGSLFRRLGAELTPALRRRLEQANRWVDKVVVYQAALFKMAGLDRGFQLPNPIGATAPLLQMYAAVDVSLVDAIFTPSQWKMGGCRPANSPYRRLAVYPHLLIFMEQQPMNNQWLGKTSADVKKAIRSLLAGITSLCDERWEQLYSFEKVAKKPHRLIGRDRAIAIIMDAVLPYMLAISKVEHDYEMEKMVLAAYYALPRATANSAVRFMAKLLAGDDGLRLIRSTPHQQGLLQMYKDFCHNYPAECSSCVMPEFFMRHFNPHRLLTG